MSPGALFRHQQRRLSAAVGATALTLALAPSIASADFQLGLQDYTPSDPTGQAMYSVLHIVSGSTVRISLPWAAVAPAGSRKPSGFDAANPADRRYDWASIDAAVRAAVQHGLRVVLQFGSAPRWAQPPGEPAHARQFPGAWNPSAADFAAFARASALRYDGAFPDPLHPGTTLPRVRYWEIWNEENLPYDLSAPNLVEEYRSLLNASYAAIKSVRRDDLVALGGLAPVSFVGGLSISPLKFAAQLLCLRRVRTSFVRARSCPRRAHFDVFADHPYTLAATPTKHAYRYDDVLIGDVGKIHAVVAAADRLHTVLPRIRHPIWVTEWSWFTNPPDKQVGDRAAVAARYTAWSMYEMWRASVSLVVWFVAKDPPGSGANSPSLVFGGGLYDSRGRAKLMLRAFAFPFVASVSRGRGYAWGRVPGASRAVVVVQRFSRHRWVHVATARTGRDGVFQARFRTSGNGRYRVAVLHGPTSLAFDSRPIPPVRTHLFNSG